MDMAGNVWEWQANYYRKEHDALGLRGGSWLDSEDFSRVSIRYFDLPDGRLGIIGFRLVVSLPNG
jgi:formylglycine-generating enzyme required for sulfatase activity